MVGMQILGRIEQYSFPAEVLTAFTITVYYMIMLINGKAEKDLWPMAHIAICFTIVFMYSLLGVKFLVALK